MYTATDENVSPLPVTVLLIWNHIFDLHNAELNGTMEWAQGKQFWQQSTACL